MVHGAPDDVRAAVAAREALVGERAEHELPDLRDVVAVVVHGDPEVDLQDEDDAAPGGSGSGLTLEGNGSFQIDGLDTSIFGTCVLQAIPEPGTALLLAAGLAGLAYRGRSVR